MSNKQNLKNINTYNLLYEFSHNYDKINIKEIEPIINDYIFEKDLSILIDRLVDIIFKELNEGNDAIVIKQHVLEYTNNRNITLQEIYNYLLNNQCKSNSIYLLGYFNYYGIGANSNKKMAIELYQNAAKLENKAAELSLINEYLYGKIVNKNYTTTFELSKNLAKEGYACALNNLGYCYENGYGTDINEEKAFELYQKAADLGNSGGMTNLGWCYYEGIGTDINYQKVCELFQKAADLGNSNGIFSLGYCYKEGIGTNVNEQKAFELYQKAVDLENLTAIYNLIWCYEGVGTDINKQKVFELSQKAANLGSSTAQYNIAYMYDIGIDVKKDTKQAIYWYKKSAEQGHQDAKKKLNELLKN
ncbi:hypothetical protein RclHR1_01080018 [Rhizophagus clarus]|uniref:Kinase-like domain-containing protein n=1 Tax=Rhizophagus clarus TaxID=94130 RepID=A0A2Z6Q721_9GLOM|nr:hypothetical protein RclHR1_01080018 [Rhizophagus clarus]GES90979.1 kinase-like domain-containing protein [Rhizophagus clarus]